MPARILPSASVMHLMVKPLTQATKISAIAKHQNKILET